MEEKEVRSELEFGVPNVEGLKDGRTEGLAFDKLRERPVVKIFYPYWAGGSKWEELRYSLRSLEKNFKEDFVVYVVGDKPDWLRTCFGLQVSGCEYKSKEQGAGSNECGEVIHIPYRRDDSRSGLWNTTRMMEIFMEKSCGLRDAGCELTRNTEHETRNDLFIRMNDDIYLIGERTLADLMVTRMVRMPEEVKSMTSGGTIWRRQALNTYLTLTDRDYAGYLTETHCPEVFSASKLQLIYQTYELPESELLPSTLYFNVFPYDRQLIDRKAERALFYGDENEFSYSSVHIENKCLGRYFLNHNDEGLTDELKRFIIEMFPEKSRWEK